MLIRTDKSPSESDRNQSFLWYSEVKRAISQVRLGEAVEDRSLQQINCVTKQSSRITSYQPKHFQQWKGYGSLAYTVSHYLIFVFFLFFLITPITCSIPYFIYFVCGSIFFFFFLTHRPLILSWHQEWWERLNTSKYKDLHCDWMMNTIIAIFGVVLFDAWPHCLFTKSKSSLDSQSEVSPHCSHL